jgi:hypothetical protein
MNVDEYLTQRVEDQVRYFESAGNREKKKFHRIQTAIIVLGVLVPVVVNLPESLIPGENSIKMLTTIFSVSLAVLTGISNLRKHGDLWLRYRGTEEMLKRERFLFLTQSGDYADEKAFHTFVTRVESVLTDDYKGFQGVIEEAKNATKEKQG